MASTYTNKDGVHGIRWREGGRNRSKLLPGATKKEAERAADRIEEMIWRGELGMLDSGKQPLNDFLDEWWTRQSDGYATATRENYETMLRVYIRPHIGGYPLQQIKTPLVDQFKRDLQGRVGPATVSKALTVLQAALRCAVLWGYLRENPVTAVKKPPTGRTRAVRPIPIESVELMRSKMSNRDAALVSLLAYAGLRPQEALALSAEDIGEQTLLIDKALDTDGTLKPTKTRRKRTVRLLAPLALDLRDLPSEGPLFQNRTGYWSGSARRNWRQRKFAPVAKKFGFEGARPYDLRHSFATLLIYEGQPIHEVAAQLGHSPAVCLNVYSHIIDEFNPTTTMSAEERIFQARRQQNVRGVA